MAKSPEAGMATGKAESDNPAVVALLLFKA